jgi:hypothetical protein
LEGLPDQAVRGVTSLRNAAGKILPPPGSATLSARLWARRRVIRAADNAVIVAPLPLRAAELHTNGAAARPKTVASRPSLATD